MLSECTCCVKCWSHLLIQNNSQYKNRKMKKYGFLKIGFLINIFIYIFFISFLGNILSKSLNTEVPNNEKKIIILGCFGVNTNRMTLII